MFFIKFAALITLTVGSLFLSNSFSVVCAQNKNDLSIPVLYLTDRAAEKPSYGSRRKYVIDCKHDMYYGTAHVVVRNSKNKTDKARFEQLAWSQDGKSAPDTVTCDQVDPSDAQQSKKAFFDRLSKALQISGDDKVCLFVHGADEGFNDAALDAAAMAYSLEYPVVMYSWPSVPKMLSYNVDGGNNEYSQGHFNQFLTDLLEFRKEHPIKIILVSHSMGNRLVIRSSHLLQHSGLVTNAELVSPDIDAETFKHYAMGLENEHATIRLYSSQRDKMLPLSQMFYGGYYRLGEGVGAAFSGFKKPDDSQSSGSQGNSATQSSSATQSNSATQSSSATQSNSAAQSNSAMQSSSANQSNSATQIVTSGASLPAEKHGLTERIDFTDVDDGFEGHTIPFDVLANMIRKDVPGHGLMLISATPGKGSTLARFMSWSHHLGKIVDDGDKDLCKKIIKTSITGK